MARMDARDELAFFNDAKTARAPLEHDFRLSSLYCLPEHYGGWSSVGAPVELSGRSVATVRRQVFDSTGMLSLPKYASVCQRLATPDKVKYQFVQSSNSQLNRIPRVAAYYDALTRKLFEFRQRTQARFTIATGEMYQSIGCYGTGPIYIGKRQPNAVYRTPTILYKGCAMRGIYILVDDNDEVIAVYRQFHLTKRQFKIKFPGENFPPSLEMHKPTNGEGEAFEFVHVVRVKQSGENDPKALGTERHPVSSSYISVKDNAYIGKEDGYLSMPYLTPRAATVSGSPYGISVAARVISSMGGASTMRKTHLKQGNVAAQPVLLAYDDGIMGGDIDIRPGAMNYGGLDNQGRPLIRPLEMGRFDVSKDLIADERKDIEDAFFVTLFQILNETPEMTATEVIERVAEKTALLSPTMGRLQSEFLGPCTQREIDLLAEMGELPEMPPELIEAKGEYTVEYTSPMAKSIRAEEAAGFMRTVEMAASVAQIKQDPSALDIFDFDVAFPEIAGIQGTPTAWLKTMDRVSEDRDARNQQQEQMMAMQNAGGLAQAGKVAAEMQNNDNGKLMKPAKRRRRM